MTELSTTPSAEAAATPPNQGGELICASPEETFALGEKIGSSLVSGDVVLLYGGLGAGKTLMTKGILHALGYDIDEVTSPSFTLVNLYKTARYDIYHIDLWRLDPAQDVPMAVGLEEIIEDPRAITIIEWADRLGGIAFSNNVVRVDIEGDGDESRSIRVKLQIKKRTDVDAFRESL